MRKTLALWTMTAVLAASSAFAAGEARISGKIVDAQTKQPIPNATIKYEAIEAKTVKKELQAKADGNYAVFILDGTIRYRFTFSAPGYQPYEEVVKLKLGEPNKKDIELAKGSAPAAATATKQVETTSSADPAIVAYNDGASLANAGNAAGAIKKFEAAVAAKPDFGAAWMALAKVQLKQKNYPAAITAAQKYLEMDEEDTDMWAVLHTAYTATGDKAKAAEALKKLPANATGLFNDAAKAINGGNDAEGEKLLKQAIAADASFANAYYELGMIYARAQKNADARQNLQKYLELDPNGPNAAMAKEMLNYVK
ncbi:MAG TPA: tetratricopeptide repeat protein [Thermoanaerobaculia bacterium]|jgi:tetratricopeptide (TPR) repeat protein